jgi:hypothetical protein
VAGGFDKPVDTAEADTQLTHRRKPMGLDMWLPSIFDFRAKAKQLNPIKSN